MSSGSDDAKKLPIASTTFVDIAGVEHSASAVDGEIAVGQTVLAERLEAEKKKRRDSKIERLANAAVPVIAVRFGENCASRGVSPDDGVLEDKASTTVALGLSTLLPTAGRPNGGGKAPFPVRQAIAAASAAEKDNVITSEDAKALRRAIRKVDNGLKGVGTGEQGRRPNPRADDGSDSENDAQTAKQSVVRAPKLLHPDEVARLPEIIRGAKNRLLAKYKAGGTALIFSPELDSDIERYAAALDTVCPRLGTELVRYAAALPPQAKNTDKTKLLRWMAKAGVVPPQRILALLHAKLHWVIDPPPDEENDKSGSHQ